MKGNGVACSAPRLLTCRSFVRLPAGSRRDRAHGCMGRRTASTMNDSTQESFQHVPVMLAETLRLLDPVPGEIHADGTAGYGGHSEAIAQALAGRGALVALDRDPEMAARTRSRLAAYVNVHIVNANFSALPSALSSLGIASVDGVLLDLGMSSPQVDDSDCGVLRG